MKLFDLLYEYTSYDDMVKRLHSVYTLISRGATEGERSAAEAAYKRLLKSITDQYGEAQARNAVNMVKSKSQQSAKPSYTYKPKPKPQEPPRQSKPHSDRAYGGKNDYYTDPNSGWTFYVLRFTDPDAGKRGSDKIWGYAVNYGKIISFWGPHGKTVRVKELSSDREALMQVAKKAAKGYRKVNLSTNPAEYAYLFNQFPKRKG